MDQENNQIVLVFIISTIFVVFLAILVTLFLVIYQKRIIKQENRLQKLENEKQQVLLKATIEGQERERKRLAKDLHDGIGSLLSGLSLNLKFQKNKSNTDPHQADFLKEAVKLVDEGIENVRTVSHNLMPATLEQFGLLSAIKECIGPINKTGEININLLAENDEFRLPSELSLGLLRVLQELIQNTIKHANATKVDVIVQFNTDKIIMCYKDNGIGFSLDTIETHGIGLKNIQSRIQALNGTLLFVQSKTTGFEVKIKAPLLNQTL